MTKPKVFGFIGTYLDAVSDTYWEMSKIVHFCVRLLVAMLWYHFCIWLQLRVDSTMVQDSSATRLSTIHAKMYSFEILYVTAVACMYSTTSTNEEPAKNNKVGILILSVFFSTLAIFRECQYELKKNV